MMPAQKEPPGEPFWADEPDIFSYSKADLERKERAVSVVLFFSHLLRFFFAFLMVAFVILLWSSFGWSPITWLVAIIYLVPLFLVLILSFYRPYRIKILKTKSREIQQRSRELTGASTIGSAIHVAGHPLLGRDQPIVIAIKGDQLLFYDYQSSAPLAALPVKDIQAVHTVVYDDERVPHVEVIDSAAQALQLIFTMQESAYSCLFRRMLKVRPVDWYQAIQQARSGLSARFEA